MRTPRVELTKTVNAINKVFQGEDKNNNGVLDEGEDTDGDGDLTRYLFPTPPDNPKVKVQLETGKVTLYWDKTAERSRDRVSGEQDFEGTVFTVQSLGKILIQSHDSLESLIIQQMRLDLILVSMKLSLVSPYVSRRYHHLLLCL